MPALSALDEVTERRAARVLLLGGSVPTVPDADEVRRAETPGPIMAEGVYSFDRDGQVDILVCRDGQPPAPPQRCGAAARQPGSALHLAAQWFDHLWPTASPVAGGPKFARNDWVRISGSALTGLVQDAQRVADTWVYRVIAEGRARSVSEDGLEALDLSGDDPRAWIELGPASAADLATSLTVTKLSNPLTDTVYSYLSSKTVFRAYQFRPVLKLLSSTNQRLLIADEVGLGKTIEAGLIWSELEARQRELRRVLVVCPAGLVEKWRMEMERRFDRRLRAIGPDDLEELMDLLHRSDDRTPFQGVVSLERLRSGDILDELNRYRPRFDLIIVDEAHALRNRGTKSHATGQLLSDWADALLFLSATPLNLGNDDLFNLLNLLAEEEFPSSQLFELQLHPNRYLNLVAKRLLRSKDSPRELLPVLDRVGSTAFGANVTERPEFDELRRVLDRDRLESTDIAVAKKLLSEVNPLASIVTRTRKVDVPDAKAVRQPVPIDVEWSAAEARVYEAVRVWASAKAARSGAPAGFVTQMPLRQAASSLPALLWRLRRRDPDLFRPTIDFDDEILNGAPWGRLEQAAEELAGAIGDLPLGLDTKFDRFADHLRVLRANQAGPVLVFSFFRATITYLAERLAPEWRVRTMNGDTKPRDRQAIIDDFRRGDFDILIASEVASEGLDFEFCGVLVNYDLPWNPMKVEQRIGRLDRFGQQHEKILILNFHVPGTIETDILERLYLRIGVFETSIGELEPILRQELREFQETALNLRLSEPERCHRLDELAVAIEARSHDIDQLDSMREDLAGLDQLLVDGFESETKDRGRFVGPQELQLLLRQFLRDGAAGSLRPVGGGGRVEVIGDPTIGDRVAAVRSSAGSQYSEIELAAMLRDGEPLLATFDNEDASHHDVELLSLRHPLVKAAVSHFAARPAGLDRFGSVKVDGIAGDWLVVIHLAESTGLRPRLELWPSAISLPSGTIDQAVADQFLRALAEGALADGPAPDVDVVRRRLEEILGHVEREQVDEERRRRLDNDRTVSARLRTTVEHYELKIERATEMRDTVEAMYHLYDGRVQNLRASRDEAATRVEAGRSFALQLRPVAIVQVVGSEAAA